MRAERYRIYEEYMLRHMGDSAHDAGHVYRVLWAALGMAESEKNVDWDVLTAAALLHDVGREEQFRTGENHALVGAQMARAFLEELGDGAEFAGKVSECIRTHRFRSDDPPTSVEAKLLYDADKLDVSGAIGIARTLVYQGRVGHPIYSMGDDGAILSGEEKTPSFYSEYWHKLAGIGDRFLTGEGKRRAKRRSETAAGFVRDLQAEATAGESGAAWRLLPRTAEAKQRRTLNVALMLAEGVDRRALGVLPDMVMGRIQADDSVAGRSVQAALALDDLGALGAAQRLIEIGRMRAALETVLDGERSIPELPTPQARSMAKSRFVAAEAFLSALRGEIGQGSEEGSAMVARVLE